MSCLVVWLPIAALGVGLGLPLLLVLPAVPTAIAGTLLAGVVFVPDLFCTGLFVGVFCVATCVGNCTVLCWVVELGTVLTGVPAFRLPVLLVPGGVVLPLVGVVLGEGVLLAGDLGVFVFFCFSGSE